MAKKCFFSGSSDVVKNDLIDRKTIANVIAADIVL